MGTDGGFDTTMDLVTHIVRLKDLTHVPRPFVGPCSRPARMCELNKSVTFCPK